MRNLCPQKLVDINCHRHPGWRVGEIRRTDKKSAQVQVCYEMNDGKEYLFWTHLDNKKEISLLNEHNTFIMPKSPFDGLTIKISG